jgi:DNA-binding protein HU-beta
MAKSMTKSEVTNAYVEAFKKKGFEVAKKQVAVFFEIQSELAYKNAKNQFLIPGIGKLVLSKSAPREMVMQFGPDKGKTIKVPAKTRIKFRIAKVAKDAILGAKK